MAMFALFEFLFLLVLGVMPLPLSWNTPPLPEDPALLRAAPADSIVFLQWYGRAPSDAATANLTERLLAEPDIVHLHDRILTGFRAMIASEMGGQTPIANECIDLALRVLSRPGCVFVGPIDPRAPNDVTAGVVVNLGEQVAVGEQTMRKLESLIAIAQQGSGGPALDPIDVDGTRFRALSLGVDGPAVTWATTGAHLVLAIGAATPAKIIAGLRGGEGLGANPRFRGLSTTTHVARTGTRSFVDIHAILAGFDAMTGPNEKAMLAAFGLASMTGVYTATGLEGDGFAMRTSVGLRPDAKDGLGRWLGTKPLTAEELAIVPADAELAGSLRVDPSIILETFLGWVGAIERGAREEFQEEVVGELAKATGLQLDKDLLAPLGDCVTVWSSPGQGSLIVSGAVLAISIDDAATFGPNFERLMRHLQSVSPKKELRNGRLRRGVFLEQMRSGAHTIHYLNTIGDDVPLAPAWCATDRHLFVSFFPQPIKQTLRRLAAGAAPDAAHAGRRATEGAIGTGFADTPALFKTIYPVLHPLAQLLVAELQREGFPIDITALPTAGSMLPHLRPSSAQLVRTKQGVRLERRGSLPTVDPLFGVIVPVFGMRMLMTQQFAAAARARDARARMEAERARAEAERARRDK